MQIPPTHLSQQYILPFYIHKFWTWDFFIHQKATTFVTTKVPGEVNTHKNAKHAESSKK